MDQTRQKTEQALDAMSRLNELTRYVLSEDTRQNQGIRGFVLTCSAFLEEALGLLLLVLLREGKNTRGLFYGYGPLSSLKAKADLCLALSLISDREHRNIELTRKIRNRFAHEIEVAFTSEDIAKLVNAMDMYQPKSNADSEKSALMKMAKTFETGDSLTKFSFHVGGFFSSLENRFWELDQVCLEYQASAKKRLRT